MPARSRAQQRFMALCAHSPAHARGQCPTKAVAREFAQAPGGLKGLPPRATRPKGSPPFTDAELRQGYRVAEKGLD